MDGTYNVYFAGGLFSHKDLIGNEILANAVERKSGGKFHCVLPQKFEQRKDHPKEIRDTDIMAVISCDLAIFNYDGTELDSGTVVEFMFAKFADIPSLLLRTDFRGGGDCTGEGVSFPWNLMTSFYPRTKARILNSAAIYKRLCGDCDAMVGEMASAIVEDLRALLAERPLMERNSQEAVYKWLAKLPDFGEDRLAEIGAALKRKRETGLI